jgi:hypothetical protein
MTNLPQIVEGETYVNPKNGKTQHNPLHDFSWDGHKTVRVLRQDLFEQPEFGKFTKLAEQVRTLFLFCWIAC